MHSGQMLGLQARFGASRPNIAKLHGLPRNHRQGKPHPNYLTAALAIRAINHHITLSTYFSFHLVPDYTPITLTPCPYSGRITELYCAASGAS
jgi:hypothetical protein